MRIQTSLLVSFSLLASLLVFTPPSLASNQPLPPTLLDFSSLQKKLNRKIERQLQSLLIESEQGQKIKAENRLGPYLGISDETLELFKKRVDERDALDLILRSQSG